MNKTFGTLLGSAALATGMTLAATIMPAQAATLACPAATAAKVTGSSMCEISNTATQDFLNTNPITVNQEAFFGFTDWEFAEKQNIGGALETDIDLDFTVTGNA